MLNLPGKVYARVVEGKVHLLVSLSSQGYLRLRVWLNLHVFCEPGLRSVLRGEERAYLFIFQQENDPTHTSRLC